MKLVAHDVKTLLFELSLVLGSGLFLPLVLFCNIKFFSRLLSVPSLQHAMLLLE
jgi:hypothetical protein